MREHAVQNLFGSVITGWLRTYDWSGALRLRTRRPFAGLALAACAGILLGESANGTFGRGPLGTWPMGPWLACGVFFALALLFTCKERGWLCWSMVIVAFAALHLFRLNDPTSIRLAVELADTRQTASADPEEGDETRPPSAQNLTARGTILDEPQSSVPTGGAVGAAGGKNWRFTLGLNHVALHGHAWDCRAQVRVFWRNGPVDLASGQRLELTGTGSGIRGPRNPGEFDMAGFLRRRGIRTEIRCAGISDVRLLPPATRKWVPTIPSLARRFQTWVHRQLTLDLEDDPDASAVVSTLLLGLRTDPGLGDLQPAFQRTGTLHFFAIDGLKLGLLSVLLVRLLGFLGVRRQWASTLVLPLLVLYALATGLGPPSVRAVMVAAVFVGGDWLGRPARPLNSLGAAAVPILAIDTNQLFELGFQLTFLVVLSILLLGMPFRSALIRLGEPDPFLPPKLFSPALRAFEWLRRRVIDLVCVSGAASVGSLPLMLIYFHVVSPISLLANVVVFPVAFGMIGLGVLSLAASLFSQVWVAWINNGNWLLAKVMLAAVRFFDAVPGGSFYSAFPDWHRRQPAAEITVLDLERGARSTYLHTRKGDRWLLDTGGSFDYQRIVLPFIHARGLGSIDDLVLSQADNLHLAAAPLVLSDLTPRHLFDSGPTARSSYLREFLKMAGQRGLPLRHWQHGDTLPLPSKNEWKVLYPPDHPAGKAAGDRALVLQLRAADWRVLFLGDSGPASLKWLAQHETPETLHSDVVIIGTAAEGLSASPELARAIAPRLIVQEAPRKAGGEKMDDRQWPASAEVLSAAKSGAITLRIYPRKIEAGGFVDGASVTLDR